MLYRVRDTKKDCWITDKVCLTPEGELYIIKRSIFGWTKIPLELSNDRYVYHQSIDLYDKDNVLVYEGDYIEAQVAEDKPITGIVAYARELSAYIILCFDTDEFYTLGSNICEYIKVVGNVFDGLNEGSHNGGEAL